MTPTALITGAGGGIGTAIAHALAPTHTLLLAGRNSTRLNLLATQLKATLWPLDLTDIAAIHASAESLSTLDVLIHNAGVAHPGTFAESTPEHWRHCFEVNVTGAVALTQALLGALRSAHGHVIFINSGAGLQVSPGLAAYSASKFAQRAFADALRADEPWLRVTSVHPGRVDTDMQRDLVTYEGEQYNPDNYLTPTTVARTVADVVATPPDAHIHHIVIRPNNPRQ